MAWIATISSVQVEQPNTITSRQVTVAVQFANGADTFVERYSFDNPTMGQLQARVKSRIAALDAQGAFIAGLVIGAPVAIPVATPPTQADLDKQAFFAAYGKLNQLTALANVGGKVKNDAEITALATQVAALYKAEYFG
jgi:hypothetical protein